MEQHLLESPTDVEERCLELGFLPFFRCGIPGFSIEEMVAREYWFTDEEGAWEWKGPIIRDGQCAYGKFFNRKAGFVSRAWLPDWINYRRSRPLAPNEDTAALDDVVMQVILAEGSATIQELRHLLGFARGRKRRTAPAAGSEEYPEEEKIALCRAVTNAGADYIKTSTGFGTDGARIEDIRLFKEHIGPNVKMKAAGGVKTVADLEMFLEAGCERIGTSSAVKMLQGEEATGY